MSVAHISLDRHDHKWCTFFNPVLLLALKALNFGPFRLFFCLFCHKFVHFSGAPFTGLNSVVVTKI